MKSGPITAKLGVRATRALAKLDSKIFKSARTIEESDSTMKSLMRRGLIESRWIVPSNPALTGWMEYRLWKGWL